MCGVAPLVGNVTQYVDCHVKALVYRDCRSSDIQQDMWVKSILTSFEAYICCENMKQFNDDWSLFCSRSGVMPSVCTYLGMPIRMHPQCRYAVWVSSITSRNFLISFHIGFIGVFTRARRIVWTAQQSAPFPQCREKAIYASYTSYFSGTDIKSTKKYEWRETEWTQHSRNRPLSGTQQVRELS